MTLASLATDLAIISSGFIVLLWIVGFEKFIGTVLRSKDMFIVLPESKKDKDMLADIIRKIARYNNSVVIILYAKKLSEKSFIVCIKYKNKLSSKINIS